MSERHRRLRALFWRLDAAGDWPLLLTPPALKYVRESAAEESLWTLFLTGRTQVGNDANTPEGVQAISAVVRRRLAIASVDNQLLRCVNDAPAEHDDYYEDDQGMMSGDDGGYTSYSQLQDEQRLSMRAQTGVYSLLGSSEDPTLDMLDGLPNDNNGVMEERPSRPSSSPKRPRWAPRLGLSENMEQFVRELRQLCEPHRDAAKEESAMSKGVPKNVHRKAVSAASVVEELKEMEYKARIGKFERVEDCISAVSACIGNQDETFAQVLTQIPDKAEALREECRKRKQRYQIMARAKSMTTGILGADTSQRATLNVEEDIDKPSPASPAEDDDSPRSTPQGAGICFSDSDLQCWPSNDEHVLAPARPSYPRVPKFQISLACEDESIPVQGEKRQHEENLVKLIGLDNPVMKNVLGMINLRRHREQAFAKLETLSKMKAQLTSKSGEKGRQKQEKVLSSPVKAENEIVQLHEAKGSAKSQQKQAGRPMSNAEKDSNGHNISIDEYQVKTDPFGKAIRNKSMKSDEESRERALGKAICALICYHAGYTNASASALSILTDVVENFLFRIGQSLTSSRENIDREEEEDTIQELPRTKSKDEVFEAFKLISASGFRGGFPRLVNYVRSDLMRIDQSIREADARLQSQVGKIDALTAHARANVQSMSKMDVDTANRGDQEASKQPANSAEKSSDVSKETIQLNDIAFTFGYITDSVHLDVLGSIKVPLVLARGEKADSQRAILSASAKHHSSPTATRLPVVKAENEIVNTM